MRCTHPIPVWIPNDIAFKAFKKHGKFSIFSDLRPRFQLPRDSDFYFYKSFLPCGKCLGCALDKREAWSVRASCELSDTEEACFVTLTYNDNSLPRLDDGQPTLYRPDLQNFLKSLRKELYRRDGRRIRYFGCGEYGSHFDRPHYHLVVYGWRADDIVCFNNPKPLYASATLLKLWTKGFSTVRDANQESIKYVAGYVAKKYGKHVPEGVTKPFVCCSLKPAIGRRWFDKYGKDLIKFSPDGAYVKSANIRLLDGSSHTIPPTLLRWWRSCFPKKDMVLRRISAASEAMVVDPDVLGPREEFHRVLHKDSLLKGVNNI